MSVHSEPIISNFGGGEARRDLENFGLLDEAAGGQILLNDYALGARPKTNARSRSRSWGRKLLDFNEEAEKYNRERREREERERERGREREREKERERGREREREKSLGREKDEVIKVIRDKSTDRRKDRLLNIIKTLENTNLNLRNEIKTQKISDNFINFSDSEDEDQEDMLVGATVNPSKIVSTNSTVPIPTNLHPSKSVNFKAVSHLMRLVGGTKKTLDRTNFFSFLTNINRACKLVPLSSASYNALLYSYLTDEQRNRIGQTDIADISSQDFVKHLSQILGAAESLNYRLSEFYTFKPSKMHTSLISWYQSIFELGSRIDNITSREVWRKFLEFLPLELQIQFKTALERYEETNGMYPSQGAAFIYSVCGDFLNAADKRFVIENGKGRQIQTAFQVKGKRKKKNNSAFLMEDNIKPVNDRNGQTKFCKNCRLSNHSTSECNQNRIACSLCQKDGHSNSRCFSRCRKCSNLGTHRGEDCPIYPGPSSETFCPICRGLSGLNLRHTEGNCIHKSKN